LIVASCAAAMAVVVLPMAVGAAIPANPLLAPATTTASPPQLPAGVRRVGNVELAPVTFQNRALFDVAGPIIPNRQEPGDQVPVEIRAAQIEENLRNVLINDPQRSGSLFGAYDTYYDPASFRVAVVKVDGFPVLMAGDRSHPNDISLLTVTDQDARYYSMTADDLANRWGRQLQDVLGKALASLQPTVVARHLELLPKIWGALVVLGAALWLVRRRLGKRRASLRQVGPVEEDARARAERSLALVSVFEWIVLSVLAVLCLGGVLWTLSLFPGTAPIAAGISRRLLAIALIWFLAGLLDRLGNAVIRRALDAWGNMQPDSGEDPRRQSRRGPTITNAAQGLKTVLVYLIAIGATVQVLGLPPVPLLTVGAILGLAVSLAVQNIIKDFTNGLLILAEDQYAVGDYISIGEIGGVVERLTLRSTRVREINGRLTTIPNGQIAIVRNAARDWARMDVTVEVAYDSDVGRALSVVTDVTETLYRDPQWSALILEPPRVLGVDVVSHAGVGIRVWIMTLPMQGLPVKREFNRRMRLALQEHGISIGIPHRVVRYEPPDGRDDA